MLPLQACNIYHTECYKMQKLFSVLFICVYKVSKDLKVLLLLLHVRGWDFVDFFPSTIVQYVAIYYRIIMSGIKE